MRIRTRTLLIAATRIAQSLVGMLLAVLLARTLDRESFGTYQQALLVSGFVFTLIAAHCGSALYYFVVRSRPEGRGREQFVNNAALLLLTTAPISLGLFLLAEPLAAAMNHPAAAGALRLFAFYPVAQGFLDQVQPVLLGMDRAWTATRIVALGLVLRVGAVGGALAISGEVQWILAAYLGATALTALVGGVVAWRVLPPGPRRLRPGILREQLAYLFPLAAATAVGAINVQLDKFLITTFFEPGEFAVYAVGALELPFIGFVTSSLQTAILPEMVERARDGNVAGSLALWQEAVRKASLVILPLFCFFVPFAGDFMVALYGQPYEAARWPFLIYLLRLPVRIALYGAFFRAIDQNRYVTRAAVLSLVVNAAVSLSLLLATRGHSVAFVAPAVGTVAASYAAAVYLLGRLARLPGVTGPVLPWGFCGRVLAVALVAAIPVLALHAAPVPPIVRLGLAFGAFWLLFGLLATARGLVGAGEWELLVRAAPPGPLRRAVERTSAALLRLAARPGGS